MIHIRLPDKLKPKLSERAAESGFDTVEEYVEALVRAEAADDIIGDEELEALLLQRVNDSESIEFTSSFARNFRKEVTRRRRARSKRP